MRFRWAVRVLGILAVVAGLLGVVGVVAAIDRGGEPAPTLTDSAVPLPVGWVEVSDCKWWHWGVADPTSKTIHYCERKIRNRAAIHAYTVAHERCHARAFARLEQWNPYDEREADACARRFGVDTSPSPYS